MAAESIYKKLERDFLEQIRKALFSLYIEGESNFLDWVKGLSGSTRTLTIEELGNRFYSGFKKFALSVLNEAGFPFSEDWVANAVYYIAEELAQDHPEYVSLNEDGTLTIIPPRTGAS